MHRQEVLETLGSLENTGFVGIIVPGVETVYYTVYTVIIHGFMYKAGGNPGGKILAP